MRSLEERGAKRNKNWTQILRARICHQAKKSLLRGRDGQSTAQKELQPQLRISRRRHVWAHLWHSKRNWIRLNRMQPRGTCSHQVRWLAANTGFTAEGGDCCLGGSNASLRKLPPKTPNPRTSLRFGEVVTWLTTDKEMFFIEVRLNGRNLPDEWRSYSDSGWRGNVKHRKKVNGMVATWSGVVLDMICNTLK